MNKQNPPTSFVIRLIAIMLFLSLNIVFNANCFTLSLIVCGALFIISFIVHEKEFVQEQRKEEEQRMHDEEVFKAIFGSYSVQEEARRRKMNRKDDEY